MVATCVKATDAVHRVTVTSSIIYCVWLSRCGYSGSKARFEVRTSFVGEGAPIEITGKTLKGKKIGKISDVVHRNRYFGELPIPDSVDWGDFIYLEAKLPKHGLQTESNRIPVRPPVVVKNMMWDRKEAGRGDVVKMTVNFTKVPDGAETTVTIREFDRDGHHDKIASFPAIVKSNKIELDWEYEYHEDTDEIPTDQERRKYGKNYNPPEYFFTVTFEDLTFGNKQESGLLLFKDWIEISLVNAEGDPLPNERYVLHLPDGTKSQGQLDAEGKARVEKLPPGPVRIEYPDIGPIEDVTQSPE